MQAARYYTNARTFGHRCAESGCIALVLLNQTAAPAAARMHVDLRAEAGNNSEARVCAYCMNLSSGFKFIRGSLGDKAVADLPLRSSYIVGKNTASLAVHCETPACAVQAMPDQHSRPRDFR